MLSLDCEELKRIDTLLLCGICYEYMETTVITPCSHNYCSLCIRKYLHYKTQCPTCFEEIFEKDLRVNKAVDQIKQYFLKLKEKLQECVKSIQNDKLNASRCHSLPAKRQDEESSIVEERLHIDDRDISNNGAQHCVSNNVGRIERTLQDMESSFFSPSTSKTSKLSTFFSPKTKKMPQNIASEKTVTCPVCKVNIAEKNINRHLDDCLKREVTVDKPAKIRPKRVPLPKLVCSLMKEAEIKKKLKELGLTHAGDRKTLESRLQRYTILYNAECDKENPRSVSELIKQCEEEENVEKKTNKLQFPKLQINRNTAENIIEEERKKYLEVHKNSFESLISKIKSTENVEKPPARRSLLNDTNVESDSVHSTSCDNVDLDESDSSLACPLQMYSSEDPRNFLTVELLASSNEGVENNINSEINEREEKSASASAAFFYSELEKSSGDHDSRGFVNKRSILSNEISRSSDTTASTKRSRTREENVAALLEDCASDFSSNDSVVYNSDSEVERKIRNIIGDTEIRESLFAKSKSEKENIESFKKRRYDGAVSEEAGSWKKKAKVRPQGNYLVEKNMLSRDEGVSSESYNGTESKSSIRRGKAEQERCPTPQRKSSRLRVKNDRSAMHNTSEQ